MPPRQRERSRSDVALLSRLRNQRHPWAWPLFQQLRTLRSSALREAIEILHCIAELLSRQFREGGAPVERAPLEPDPELLERQLAVKRGERSTPTPIEEAWEWP